MHRDDPADMSIDERLDEVASLLGTGFLRLKRRTGCLPPEAFLVNPLPHGRGSDCATFESEESSKIPADSTCHLSENPPPLCPALTARDRGRMEANMAERLNIAREVAALKRMTVKELRGRYVEVFGEATRSGNKDWLWKRIAWRMQANAGGDQPRQIATGLSKKVAVRPPPLRHRPPARSRGRVPGLARPPRHHPRRSEGLPDRRHHPRLGGPDPGGRGRPSGHPRIRPSQSGRWSLRPCDRTKGHQPS